jgi:RNA polymerase sigma-70 factor, ECF subfamily
MMSHGSRRLSKRDPRRTPHSTKGVKEGKNFQHAIKGQNLPQLPQHTRYRPADGAVCDRGWFDRRPPSWQDNAVREKGKHGSGHFRHICTHYAGGSHRPCLPTGSLAGTSAPSRRVLESEPVVSDDAQLIDRALQGQTEAFGQLVLKYQDRLFNTVFHVVGHAEDARDIVQEAMVQAFLKLETFQRHSAFYTWLYRIAFNVAMTQRRKRRPTMSIDQARETSHMEPVDCEDSPAEALDRKERCRQVRHAIGQLAEEHRAVLVLREIDGCCYETIADILDLPIGTVRSRLHRARLELRDALKGMLASEGIRD